MSLLLKNIYFCKFSSLLCGINSDQHYYKKSLFYKSISYQVRGGSEKLFTDKILLNYATVAMNINYVSVMSYTYLRHTNHLYIDIINCWQH